MSFRTWTIVAKLQLWSRKIHEFAEQKEHSSILSSKEKLLGIKKWLKSWKILQEVSWLFNLLYKCPTLKD